MLRILIVDDEPLARQSLRQQLQAHPDVVIAGEAGSAVEARGLLEKQRPDALFLDVRMPGADAFDLLSGLENPPPVVFVTGYAEHAVEAFAFDAVDYLLKPVRAARLADALARLRGVGGEGPRWQRSDRVCFRTPQRTLVARFEAILYLQAEGDFTRVVVRGEPPLLICRKLGHYEQELTNPPFVRIDRSLMVNRDRIKRLDPVEGERGLLFLEGLERPLELGRTARRRLGSVLE